MGTRIIECETFTIDSGTSETDPFVLLKQGRVYFPHSRHEKGVPCDDSRI
jgi:hypothetical protein